MNPQTASRTALGASLMRALHARADPYPILIDPWGDRLIPEQALATIYQAARSQVPSLPESADASTMRAVVDRALHTNAAYANVIARSRFAEDALQLAVESGIRQYGLIGAGFDSYALRMPAGGAGVTVIEIDHPATQAFKRECIAKSGTALPSSVHFLAADLSTEDLVSVLRRSPMRLSEPAFFSWLGVSMYLSRDANLATLRSISSAAAPGSELVFTYFDQSVFEAQRSDMPEAVLALRSAVAAMGEPFLSGFDPATLEKDMLNLGYALQEDLSDVELLRRYDPEGKNGLIGSGRSRTARARVLSAS